MIVTTAIHQNRAWMMGQTVACNGYLGTIERLFDGDMACMAEVRVPGGVTCVGLSELAKQNPVLARRMDRRWSCRREYCGHAKPWWVVRFCGDWIGSRPTKALAMELLDAAASVHNAKLGVA